MSEMSETYAKLAEAIEWGNDDIALALAQQALDEGNDQHGDDGYGAGGADFTEIPGEAGGDHEDEPGAVGRIFEGGDHQRIT